MSNSRVNALQHKHSAKSPNKDSWAVRPSDIRLRETGLLHPWFDDIMKKCGAVTFEPVRGDLDKGMHVMYLHLAPEVCFCIFRCVRR